MMGTVVLSWRLPPVFEAVADVLAAGGVGQGGAGVAGEVPAAGEAGDVADQAEDLRGGDDTQAVDLGQTAARRNERVAQLGLVSASRRSSRRRLASRSRARSRAGVGRRGR